MKKATEEAVNKALENYKQSLISSATVNAIKAHVDGDILAHRMLHIPIGKNEVQAEALIFGRKYKKLLKETGGTVIRGQRIDWLANQMEETRAEVHDIIEQGLTEGKPVASIGGKHSVPGTVAHDLEKLAIRTKKFEYVRIARTETATIQNQATLNRFHKNDIAQVRVVDGVDFDAPCREANGQIWSVDYAKSHELEHPNCTRTFAPIIPDDWVSPGEEEYAPVVKKIAKVKKVEKIVTNAKVAKDIKVTLIKELDDLTEKSLSVAKTPGVKIDIVDELADRQIKTSNFSKLAPNVDYDDPAHWDELMKRGWPKDAKTFNKGGISPSDVIHLDKDGNVFAISRYEIKGKTLRIKELEINPKLTGPQYGKAVIRDIADDGLANAATEINVTAWSDSAIELFNSAGLKQAEIIKSSFKADLGLMKELSGKTDLIVTSRAKETSRITRYLKKLEKSDPDKVKDYRAAVNAYTTDRYKIINQALRDGIDSDVVKARMTIAEHTTLKREIVNIDDYLKGAPKIKGEVYRGVSFDDKVQFDRYMKNIVDSDEMINPSFTSTSILRTDAEYFGRETYSATLKIKSKSGSYIGGISDFKEETEVLFGKGTRFKVKKIIKVSDKHFDIELEDLTVVAKKVTKTKKVAAAKKVKKVPEVKKPPIVEKFAIDPADMKKMKTVNDLKGQRKIFKVAELTDSADPEDIFKILKKNGWSHDSKVFTKGNILPDDEFYVDMNQKIFGMSRHVIDGDTLKVVNAELTPGVDPFFGNTIVNSNVDDMVKLGLKKIEFVDVDDKLVTAVYKDFGLVKKGKVWTCDEDWLEVNFGIASSETKVKGLEVFNVSTEKDKVNAYVKSLDLEDRLKSANTLIRYTSEDYKDINKILKHGINSPEAMKLPPATYNKAINDIDALSDFLQDAPKFNGKSYRGVRFRTQKDLDDFIKVAGEHDKVHMPAFTSSSANQEITDEFIFGEKFSVLMKIESKKGTFIGDLSVLEEELEILFNKNTAFKIKNILKINKGKYEMTLEDLT